MVNTWDQLTVEAESVSLGDGHLRALANQKWSWWSRDLVLTNHSSPGRGWWRARCGQWHCGRWWWACTPRSGTCSSAITFIVCSHYIKYFGILQACPTMNSTVHMNKFLGGKRRILQNCRAFYTAPLLKLVSAQQLRCLILFDCLNLSTGAGVGTQFITLPL